MKGMIFVPEIIENFYGDKLYTLTNTTCSCKEDIIYEAPYAEPHRTFKIFPEDNIVRFAYKAKKGLVRLNPNGITKQENIWNCQEKCSQKTPKI